MIWMKHWSHYAFPRHYKWYDVLQYPTSQMYESTTIAT